MTDDDAIGLAEYGGGRRRQRFCSFEGCKQPFYAKKMCQTHYVRLRRHGDASIVIANEDRRNVRLSAEKAQAIRAMRAAGHTLKVIGDEFNVHLSTAGKITTGKHWLERSKVRRAK